MSVTLRSRRISGGRLSWSADIQPTPIIDGKPKRFWTLDIYTVEKPKSAAEKAQNTALMERAEAKRAKLYLMAMDGALPGRQAGKTVAAAMQDIYNGHTKKGTRQAWKASIQYIMRYGIGATPLSELTPQQCVGFRGYLLTCKISLASASTYLAKFRAMLRQAKRTGAIKIDLRDAFNPISSPQAQVGWIEQVDMDKLFATPTRSGCRRPFIFACLGGGLRHSDLAKLDWSEITDNPDGSAELQFKAQKTGKLLRVPIGGQARSILGARSDGRVFPDIPNCESYNAGLKRWAIRAGLDIPHISSHKARHTWAVIALDSGVPLEIVREVLGHSSVVQTEVYAQVRAERVRQYAGVVKTSVDVSMMPKLRKVK